MGLLVIMIGSRLPLAVATLVLSLLCVVPAISAPDTPSSEREKAVTILKAHKVREVVFAIRKVDGDGHWYANFSHWSSNPERKLYHDGGRLVRLNVESGETVTLLNDETGGVRDMSFNRVAFDDHRCVIQAQIERFVDFAGDHAVNPCLDG